MPPDLDTRAMLESVGGSEEVQTQQPEPQAQQQPAEVTAEKPAAPWWAEKAKEEVEYTANGKTIKEPLEMILKRASQGYNYAQHMDEFNRTKSQFEQERAKWEAIDKKWKPYEDFAAQNPEYNKFLEEQWAKREQWKSGMLADPDNPMTPVVLKLQEQIEALKNEFSGKFQSFEVQKEDTALDNEIKNVKTKFSDFDFDARDELGRSVEYRVLEHATKAGIKTFEAAFKDLYHDELVKRAESRAKEQLLKESQSKKSQGIIGGKPTPSGQALSSKINPKNFSYDQLSKIAIQELQQSGMN